MVDKNYARILFLEQCVAEDPTDPFNYYALALEWIKADKPKAKAIFDELIASKPDYVPAYYQTALLYIEMNLNENAAQLIEQGIAQAKKQNNMKAANELRALLDEMEE